MVFTSFMKLYITAPFKGEENKNEIENLCNLVRAAGFEDFCFIRDVENYQKVFNDPKELMARLTTELAACDGLLIDLTYQSTGQLLEMGMAYAMGKKIIALMKKDLKISDTARGAAGYLVEYENWEEIKEKLKDYKLN